MSPLDNRKQPIGAVMMALGLIALIALHSLSRKESWFFAAYMVLFLSGMILSQVGRHEQKKARQAK